MRLVDSFSFVKSLIQWLKTEYEITWRMLIDNALASFIPGLVLVTAVCLRHKLPLLQIMAPLGRSCVLSSLYTYVFDASNQTRGADEDKINKPYRPIPRSLLTTTGAMRRFWFAMTLYTITGYYFDVLQWVAMWQVSTIIINVWCPPRHYFWCKTLCMSLGVRSQLSQAWLAVSPIDATGSTWLTFMAVAYPLPLIFEDVRDMAGDEAVGRKTLALMLGALPICVWFFINMTVMPFLVQMWLFVPSSTASWRLTLCTMSFTALCWYVAVRAIAVRTVRDDRVTYQLFILTYIVLLLCGCIIWA